MMFFVKSISHFNLIYIMKNKTNLKEQKKTKQADTKL
jgi:hypothetical protein